MADKFSESDFSFMRLALRLAKRGGRTSPNPPVGAVIVKNKKILSTGYHRGPGTPHAEADALTKLKGQARGATAYVSLEPCCHTEKRTPPCVEALLKAGIKRVVVGVKDPNPHVNGKGIRKLLREGVKVEWDCLKTEAQTLIRAYGQWIKTGYPYLILKAAMTLDGKIATEKGESHWITGERARKKVHELRAQVDAVLVGFQTVMKDDPELTVRTAKGSSPIRVVLDSRLRLPVQRKIFSQSLRVSTVLAVLRSQKNNPKVTQFQRRGIHLLFCRADQKGRVDLSDLFRQLGNRGIASVMVEGGASLASALMKEGWIDELMLFVAPRILGGSGLDLFRELKVDVLKKTPWFSLEEISQVGPDALLRLIPQK